MKAINLVFSVALAISSSQAVSAIHQCKDKDGNIKFSDKPCTTEEATLMTKEEKKSIYLVRAMGESTYNALKKKSDDGDKKARELLRVIGDMEYLKLYALTMTFKPSIEGCMRVDKNIGEAMKSSYDQLLKVRSKEISKGKQVYSKGISSNMMLEMNVAPEVMQASTEKKVKEIEAKFKYINASNQVALATDCRKTYQALDLLSRM